MFVLVTTAMSVVVGSRKLCPGFRTGAKGFTVRSMSEGEQGWALPPVYLVVCGRLQTFFHLGHGTWFSSMITSTPMCGRKWSVYDLKPLSTCDLKPVHDSHAWFGRHMIPCVVDESLEMCMTQASAHTDKPGGVRLPLCRNACVPEKPLFLTLFSGRSRIFFL